MEGRDVSVVNVEAVVTDGKLRAVGSARDDLLTRVATREDLAALDARILRALPIQAGVIVGAVVALLRL